MPIFRSPSLTSTPSSRSAVPCVKCGYDLQGTAVGGNCPECGTKVAVSLRRSDFYIDGHRLVINDGTTLPEFCVKTGRSPEETGGKTLTKTLNWVPPATYLLLLVNILVLLIVYVVVKKPCRVTYFVSDDIRRRYFFWQMIGLGMFILGALSCVGTGLMLDTTPQVAEEVIVGLVIGSIVIGLAGLVVILFFQNHVAIKKHRNGQFWLGGLRQEFLAKVRAEMEMG